MIIIRGTKMEIPYSEDRDDTRFDHISSLRVKDLRSGEVYEAKMLNYSNGGINFESNSLLQKGEYSSYKRQNTVSSPVSISIINIF